MCGLVGGYCLGNSRSSESLLSDLQDEEEEDVEGEMSKSGEEGEEGSGGKRKAASSSRKSAGRKPSVRGVATNVCSHLLATFNFQQMASEVAYYTLWLTVLYIAIPSDLDP